MKKKLFTLSTIAIMAATNITAFADSNKEVSLDNQASQIEPLAQYSIINANNVNLRKTPSTSGTILRQLHKGYKVLEYSDPVVKANGYTWQKVSYGGTVGWVAINYLDSLGR